MLTRRRINNLGVSALVGLGVLLLSFPLQGLIVGRMIGARRNSLRLTDRRVRLLQEVLQGIRLLVLFVRCPIAPRSQCANRRCRTGRGTTSSASRACVATS